MKRGPKTQLRPHIYIYIYIFFLVFTAHIYIYTHTQNKSPLPNVSIGNDTSAQSFLALNVSDPGTPTQIAGHPSDSLSKTTEKGALHKVFVRNVPGRGQGYPDVWVPDVPGIPLPKTLSLGYFFCPESTLSCLESPFAVCSDSNCHRFAAI